MTDWYITGWLTGHTTTNKQKKPKKAAALLFLPSLLCTIPALHPRGFPADRFVLLECISISLLVCIDYLMHVLAVNVVWEFLFIYLFIYLFMPQFAHWWGVVSCVKGLGLCVRDASGAKMIHRRLTPPACKTKPLRHMKLYVWILALIGVRPPVLGTFRDEYLCWVFWPCSYQLLLIAPILSHLQGPQEGPKIAWAESRIHVQV